MIQKTSIGLLSLALGITIIHLPAVNADEVVDEEIVEVEIEETVEVVEVVEELPPVSADEEMAPDILGIEEIIVTSRKREESLQSVPISVTAFTAADLEEMNTNSVAGISEFTPNLMINKTASGSNAMVACMRGLCRTDTTITDDPYVGIYMDGVYTGKAMGSVFDIADIERVEVLRGPQGTLFGKNTLAGAINVVTAKPSGEAGAKLQVLGGSEDQRSYKAILDMPAFGDVKTKFSFLHKEHDPFTKNLVGTDLGTEDKDAVLVAALWDVTSNFSLDWSFDWTEVDEVPPANFSTFTIGSDFFGNPVGGSTPTHTRRNGSTALYTGAGFDGNAGNDATIYGHSLTANWDLGTIGGIDNANLKSITAYRKTDNEYQNNSSGLSYRSLWTRDDFVTRNTSQELQFSGTALDDRLEILVGAYYLEEKGDYSNLQGFLIGPDLFDILNYTEIDYQSVAFFTEETFWITDQLALSAGVRYTDEDRDADHIYQEFFNGFPATIVLDGWNSDNGVDASAPPVVVDTNFTSDTWSPRATLKYEFDDDTMVFGGWSRGYKSGGFNARAATGPLWNPYDDMRVDSYETGVKSSFWDNRARLNATFFYEDIKDMQLQFNDPGFNVTLANAGDAYVYGAEVEGALRPVAGLDITAGFGYTHENLDKAINPTTGIDEKSDRHFEYSPTYNWNASVRYAFPPLQVGNLVTRVDYRGSSAVGFNSSVSDDKIVGQSSYGVFDARLALNDVGVDWLGGSFDFALIGRNLADKSYKTGGFTFGVPGVYRWATNTYGDPRTYAAEATWRWGSQQ